MDRLPDASEFSHEPVMLREILDLVATAPAGIYVDLTLGGAGHARAVLERCPELRLVGFDQDTMAIAAATERLAPLAEDLAGERVAIHRCRFDAAPERLVDDADAPVAAFLMDLGVSSPQLDIAERGFSFRHDGPLDMRMDPDATRTASDVVNGYPRAELIDVISSYGDERSAKRIADAIIASRPISSTARLAEIVAEAVPAAVRRTSTVHPATKTFQAIRIEVNDELAILGTTVDAMIELLAPGGIGVVLTYHSGEDRIVKDSMRRAIDADTLPGMPTASEFEWAFRGARTPSEAEIEANPRARSARLRAIRRRSSDATR